MSRYTLCPTRTIILVITLLLLALLASGCDGRAAAPTPTPTPAPAAAEVSEAGFPESLLNPDAGGASVWIEFPLEGQALPEGAVVTFVIYASSAGGVEAISLTLNSEPMPPGTLKDLSNDGDGSMVRLEQTWQPPGPGEYVLAAQAAGASASTTFCVVHCGVDFEVEPSETPTLAPGPTETPTATPVNKEIKFWADPASFSAGGCTTLRWEVPPGTQMVSLGDDLIDFANVSSQKECLCESRAYKMFVMLADGTTEERSVMVTVTGSCTQPEETEPILSFWAEPQNINAGKCTTLHWEVEGYSSVTLNGNPVGFAGTDEECPCPSETYTLTGTRADGTTENRTVTVNVTGSCDLPSTEPPLEPPPADTNGPEFEWTSLVWEGCTFYGQAQIKDPSGVSQAKFEFGVNYEGAKSLWMESIGNGIWQSEVGISIGSDGMSTPMGGTIEYRMWAKDTLTNESYSIQKTETYDACIE